MSQRSVMRRTGMDMNDLWYIGAYKLFDELYERNCQLRPVNERPSGVEEQ